MNDSTKDKQKPRRIEASSSSSGIEGQEQSRSRLNKIISKLPKLIPSTRKQSQIRRQCRKKLIGLHPIEEHWENLDEEVFKMIQSIEENKHVFQDGPETLWLSFQKSPYDADHLENAKEVIRICKMVKAAREYLERACASKITSTPEIIEYFNTASECLDKADLLEIPYLKDLYIQVLKKIKDLSAVKVKNELEMTKSNNELVRHKSARSPSSFHDRSRSVEPSRTPCWAPKKAPLRTPVHNNRFDIVLNLHDELALGIGFPKAIQKLLEVDVLGLGLVGDGKLHFQGLYDCIKEIERYHEVPETLRNLLHDIREYGNDLRHGESNLLSNPSGYWHKVKEILKILYPNASLVHYPSSEEMRLKERNRELEQWNQELERRLDARGSGGQYGRRNSGEYHSSYSPRRDHYDDHDRKRYRDDVYDHRSPSPSHKRSRRQS